MFGHQFVTHLNPQLGRTGKVSAISNPVDGHGVPIPHFKDEPGEQGTMFF